jgi:hypothetical protein
MESEVVAKAPKPALNKRPLIIAVVIMALLNGYFSCNNRSLNQRNVFLEQKRQELDSLYKGVTAELINAELSLDTLKGKNSMLDSMIIVREQEIESAKEKITLLLKNNQLNLVELDKARGMVRTLQIENDKFLAQINELNQKISLLTASNDSLLTELELQLSDNDKLAEAKKILSKKAELASMLKPENIKGTGVKLSSNNTESETNVAKKSDRIKVCFDIPFNRVTNEGQKELLVRIINPSGSTIAVESQGSGTFTNVETNELTTYTSAVKFQYNKSKMNLCTGWQQNHAFGKGVYKVMFYQNGYFLTEGSFTLK